MHIVFKITLFIKVSNLHTFSNHVNYRQPSLIFIITISFNKSNNVKGAIKNTYQLSLIWQM